MHEKAKRILRTKVPVTEADPALADRLPPGQVWTERFPILHEGKVPEYDMSTWSLRVFGEVEEQRVFTYEELLKLPQTAVTCDIHCVTRWSKADTLWEGVLFRDFLRLLKVKPEATHVMVHADPEYDTNVPLADLLGENVLLAHRYGGEQLKPKHGWPLRLLVPHLYFWKSAKWVRGLEFMKGDRPGFWESNGFHAYGEPFGEQRFSEEGYYMPEDEWVQKDYD